jgi:hypothetical protein
MIHWILGYLTLFWVNLVQLVIFEDILRILMRPQNRTWHRAVARCIIWGNPRRKLTKPTWHTVASLTPEQKARV